MFAVAVQLPVELEPDASAGIASVSSAQIADAADFMLIRKPLSPRFDERKQDRRQTLRRDYKTLKW